MRPILMGMNHPTSTKPGHELYPLPSGCTGNRLWQMLTERTQASMRQYCDTFERRNLVRAHTFDKFVARARAFETIVELRNTGRTVVLLGNSVREAFDWAFRNHERMHPGIPPLLVHPQEAGGCTWRQVPHPSGRNLFYNEEQNRKVVALLLEELYMDYHKRMAA